MICGARSLLEHTLKERTLIVCSVQLGTTALARFCFCRTDAIPAQRVALKVSLSTMTKSQR